jgi:hypothetical protein
MTEKSDSEGNPLDRLGDSFSGIVGPNKGRHLAMTEEALRVATGGKPDRYDQMEGDVWLNRALRMAVDVLEGDFDYEADSLQKRLLNQLHEKEQKPDVWEQFENARKVRREALYEIAARALTGRSHEDIRKQIGESATLKVATMAPGVPGILEKAMEIARTKEDKDGVAEEHGFTDYREFALARLAAVFPEHILPSIGFRQMMDLALLSGRGRELIPEIAKEFSREKKAAKTLGVTQNELVMIVNWVNPDYPLWLATEEALAAILRSAFELEEITEGGARRMRNRKLRGESPYPILGFSTHTDGRHEFRLAKGLSTEPSGSARDSDTA